MARKPRVLIVEDEPDMAGLLVEALKESGFEAESVGDGKAALRVVAEFDLAVMDVMMPTMNGFEAVRRMRAEGCRAPVLFLTAMDSVSDRVKGLEVGGDDYLLKPFALEELIARCRALIRRSRDGQDVLEYADLWLDRRERKARRDGEWLYLSNTEFAVLEAFMLSPEVTLSKASLLRDIWHDDEGRDDNIVEVYVGYLRQKTEFMGKPRLLRTVRGAGYVLDAREA